MPRIYDNIESRLLDGLRQTLQQSTRADFCVGYFNLRGWKLLDDLVEPWSGGEYAQCRLLVGMQKLPQEELREEHSLLRRNGSGSLIDRSTAVALKKQVAQEFRDQLVIGAPTNADTEGLHRLKAQLEAGKVAVKLYLKHPLHAKLYLMYRDDYNNPITGILGSSNLTFPGLQKQGELNVDVLDQDACHKLERWFEDRWNDRWCLDITKELASILDESWIRTDLTPYDIYIKIAYHLSQEAREGLSEFRIPSEFNDTLFDFQKAAVQIAAHHLNRRDGVLIGDVVGLGKTLMATAVAKIAQDDFGLETLVICPKNLVSMWEDYLHLYEVRGKVMSQSNVLNHLANQRRFRVVVIDESHNLRNPKSKRFRAIQEYVARNESKCILLSATPYNKTYTDLSTQLSLFVPRDQDLGIRPERLLRDFSEVEFTARHQCGVRTLEAFEKSEYPEDWRDLMRLYMVRRTRNFIQENYAETDSETGRQYLQFGDGSRSYFPARVPRSVKFATEESSDDPYSKLYSDSIVSAINDLNLPRYGLINYVRDHPTPQPTREEQAQIDNLSRAGRRLMGFSRTGLFKRLESGGPAFIQSLERHILRNYVFLYALENDLPVPIGTQDIEMLAALSDEDLEERDDVLTSEDSDEDPPIVGGASADAPEVESRVPPTSDQYRQRAEIIYNEYRSRYQRRFKWLRASIFNPELARDLQHDADSLGKVVTTCGPWDPTRDNKLDALHLLLTNEHPNDKVLIFTQYADTVSYLVEQLRERGVEQVEGVTGESENPTSLAWRFSPQSNGKRGKVSSSDEIRVLVSTDVLSEGQNLQDCSLIVNYDLPWAIIRLIQRAGRVDRIGQTSDTILCYSFVPAEGVERLIRLRERVRARLHQNAEVVGAEDRFFEDDLDNDALVDLYTEKSGILDGDADTEVDLASYAYQIWKNATEGDSRLARRIEGLPNLVNSTRVHSVSDVGPEGVLVYMRTAQGNDTLAWVDREGNPVTQSQFAILQAAACEPGTPAIPLNPKHHELVERGIAHLVEQEGQIGGNLGKPSGARYKTYNRLKDYAMRVRGTLFDVPELHRTIDDIYRYPLRSTASDTLNRQLRSGISDEQIAELVIALQEEGRLCNVEERPEEGEPSILCTLGIFNSH